MDITLEGILEKNDLIKLRSNEYVVITNSRLNNLVSIIWTYADEKLVFTKIAPEMEEFMKPNLILQDEHYLILEPDDKGYERGLFLKVGKEENRILVQEILKPTLSKGNFEVIYQ
jgi:hypothetical protein